MDTDAPTFTVRNALRWLRRRRGKAAGGLVLEVASGRSEAGCAAELDDYLARVRKFSPEQLQALKASPRWPAVLAAWMKVCRG